MAARSDADVEIQVGGHPEPWDNVLSVTTPVANAGNVTAHAVLQLYVSFSGIALIARR